MKKTKGTRHELHNVQIGLQGHRTSLRLEPEFWDALKEICEREETTLAELVEVIEHTKHPISSLASATRLYCFAYFRAATTEEGHAAAQHKPKMKALS